MTPTSSTSSFDLLRATDAVTNWRALAMCGIAGLATFICAMLTGYAAHISFFLFILLAIITLLVSIIGFSAVGIILMNHATGQRVGFIDAILRSTLSIHRFLGVSLLLALTYLAVFLSALIIFLVCKIPGIGPLFYAVAFPVVSIIIGVVFIGVGYVVSPLAAPAIWEGNTVFQTAARLFQITRERFLDVILQFFMLFLLVFVISLVVFGILFNGAFFSTSISAAVGVGAGGLDLTDSISSLFGGIGGMNTYGGLSGFNSYGGFSDLQQSASSGQMIAMAFGIGLLVTLGLIIPCLVYINGVCLIYLKITSGMDFSKSEEKLRQKIDAAKKKAEEAKIKTEQRMREAKAASDKARSEAQAAAAQPIAAPQAQTVRHCVSCHAPLAADDEFCGECGTPNPRQ